MVSFTSSVLIFLLGKFGNMNPINKPEFFDRVIKGRSKPVTHKNKKGYILSIKETENKSRYIILKKDNKVEAKKVVYYMHGGGYIMRMISMYEDFCYFCDLRDDIEVVLLDYSLAPENKYPTQLNEATDVWNEITKTFKPEDIIVGGDSSGGNLSLALIHKLKKEMNVAPRAGFFFSPDTDLGLTAKSYFDNYRNDIMFGEKNGVLTKEKWEQFKNSKLYTAVIDETTDLKDPYVSPLYGDFTTFPKSFFNVGTYEMALDDTLRIVEKIKANGNEVELLNKEGMFHVYPINGSFTPEGKEALGKVDNFIIDSFKN